MARLIIMRGLPGCGKSTQAREWVEADPNGRAEVNRDAIRLMIGGFVFGTPAQEKMVTKVQHDMIRTLLRAGIDVVSSDTNLTDRYLRDLYKIAHSAGADIQVWDMTHIDIDTVLERNRYRKDKEPIPHGVIMRMYHKSIAGKGYPLPVPDDDSAGKAPDFWELNLALVGARMMDICDIDGTVADHQGIRSPYDYSLVSEDRPRRRMVELLQDRFLAGKGLIFMSGRPDINDVRRDTEEWLRRNVGVPFEALYMRPADMQQIEDSIVKRHLFDKHVRDGYNLTGVVFDDRDRVVQMWRTQLGLDCHQVNYGDF